MCTYAPLVLDPLISKVHIITRENQPIEWLTWISRSTLCKIVEMYCSGISFFFHIWDSQIFNFFCVANQVETILKNKQIFYFIKIILWKNWKKGCLVIVKWTREPLLCESVAVGDFTSLWTVLLLAFATFQYQSIPRWALDPEKCPQSLSRLLFLFEATSG